MLTNVGCRLSGLAAIAFALVRRLPEAPREIAELGVCPMPGGVALCNAEGPTGQTFFGGEFAAALILRGPHRSVVSAAATGLELRYVDYQQ
jgi:hypothetical protein